MFSMPLLYTMEVWWAGFLLHPLRILVYGIVTFGLLLLYNRFAGLRRDASLVEVVIDSVEELGIGMILAALILWLTDRIHTGMVPMEMLGKVVMEGMTVAIGVSIGTAQLGADDRGDEGIQTGEDSENSSDYFPQLALALCGAVLFAANIAPTDESIVIAIESPPGKLLLIALFSMMLGLLVLQFSGFRNSTHLVASDTVLHRIRGVISTYAVALVASLGALWFFGKLDGQPPAIILAQTVVLGFPAVLGASAGRLLLQGSNKNKSES